MQNLTLYIANIAKSAFADDSCPVGVNLVLFDDKLADAVRFDVSAFGIDNAVDVTAYIRFNGGIFKRQRGIYELAVLHFQIVYIAHSLETFNGAVYQREIF